MKKIAHYALIISLILIGLGACKNKEKVTVDPDQERIEQEAAKLRAELETILADTTLTADELDSKLDKYRNKTIDDAEAKALLAKAEQLLKEKRQAEAELKEKEQHEILSLEEQLYQNFEKIATAPDYDKANSAISETLQLFEQNNALVLIITYRKGDQVDYDKPTTAVKYLNYLKDQKKNPHKIDDLVKGSSGKIKELILIVPKQ